MLRESFPAQVGSRPPVGGLADSIYTNAAEVPDFVQLERKIDGRWVEVTARQFHDEVLALAKGLLARGLRFGDRVGIMARTCYEWTLFDYALWSIGVQTVPLYPTASAEQVRHILGETQAVACVVEHEDHTMTLGAGIDVLRELNWIWELNAGAVEEISADAWQVNDDEVHRHRLAVTPDSVATVVYTSGTTGLPKGCLVTHGNIVQQSDLMTECVKTALSPKGGTDPASLLLFLPLAHIYGRTVQVGCFRRRVRLAHQPSMAAADILADLATFRPTFVPCVPSVFEKVFHTARRKAEAAGQGKLFEQAVETAVRYAEERERQAFGRGRGPGLALRLRHRVYDRPVYSRVRDVFGGRMGYAGSGGSRLARRIGLFFHGAGVTILDSYGLTESTAGVTCAPPQRPKFGTVGPPVGDTEIRIAQDGEILLRGPQVFHSYLGDGEGSYQTLRDGWLTTGDLGAVDEDGYLTLTGRKKDIIVTSGGKSVSPMMMEERVRCHPLIAQCIAVGEDRPYIVALITLDPEALRHWLAILGKLKQAAELVLSDPDLEAEIRRAVAAANALVSRAESIRKFWLLPAPFTYEQGLLTPSQKLKRKEIERRYARQIEELYAEGAVAGPRPGTVVSG